MTSADAAPSTSAGPWQSAVTLATSSRGGVAASNQQAAEAGAEMLRQGGNAVDAVAAAAFAAFVVEPQHCGVAGYGRLAVRLPGCDECVVVDHNVRAPAGSRGDIFEVDGHGPVTEYGWPDAKSGLNSRGALSVAVPGAVAGICSAVGQLGRLPLAQVLEPAIEDATRGVPVDWELVLSISEAFPGVAGHGAAAALLLPGGRPPQLWGGDHTIDTSPLAGTLRLIAREGADGFYTGPVARAIDREVRKGGGVLTAEDLAAYRSRIFRESPAPFAGWDYVSGDDPIAYETLGILQRFPLADYGPDSVQFRHLMAEALGCAFVDNVRHYGDGEPAASPAAKLRGESFANERARGITLDQAAPRPIAAADPCRHDSSRRPAAVDGTGQVTAVDSAGMAASLITTIGSPFGSGIYVEDGGFFLNNGMRNFDPRPGRANSIAPRKMPIFAAPVLVGSRDGAAQVAIAGSGGYRIETGVLHSFVNYALFGLGLDQAVSHPRVHCQGEATVVDGRIPLKLRDRLRELGHHVVVSEQQPWPIRLARVSAVARDSDGTVQCVSWPAWSGGAAAP